MSHSSSIQYNPKLDSLRAFAVILVIIHHWIPGNKILNFFPNGMMGITLFFVLSGYLITAILFNAKEKYLEDPNRSSKGLIKTFFIRRFLRLVPIYFLCLFALFLLGSTFLKEYWMYLFTYTQNFLYYKLGYWPQEFSHLWTLAIEEQYYLIWPWLVIFIPKKRYLALIIGMIAIGLLSKITLFTLDPYNKMNGVLLLPSFFSFGLGGLLAYVRSTNIVLYNNIYFKFITGIIPLFFVICVILGLEFAQKELFAIISFIIIYYLSDNRTTPFTRVITYSPIVFIGRISYGLYLFHPFVGKYYSEVSSKINAMNPENRIYEFIFPGLDYPILRLAWLAILLIGIASVSWYLIEKPINKFKKHFSYI